MAEFKALVMKASDNVATVVDTIEPDPDDELIRRLGDPAWLAWMHANFREPGAVAELGGADSYARRLRDYAGTGRDQVAWLASRAARRRRPISVLASSSAPCSQAAMAAASGRQHSSAPSSRGEPSPWAGAGWRGGASPRGISALIR